MAQTDAKTLLGNIRTIVGDVSGISRVNSSRKKDSIATGQYVASVLYRGEDIQRWGTGGGQGRHEHTTPIAIDIRTAKDDDDLIDKLYAVLDAVTSDANKPEGVTSLLAEGIDEPEFLEDYLTCRINLTARFRRD